MRSLVRTTSDMFNNLRFACKIVTTVLDQSATGKTRLLHIDVYGLPSYGTPTPACPSFPCHAKTVIGRYSATTHDSCDRFGVKH
eukprot:6325006-Amphidinium_carterae.1